MAEKFLKNAWYCAADGAEVTSKPLGRMFLNEPVVMYRLADGTAVALEDTCCHRRAPLSLGKLVGDNIECPYHGMQFDHSGKAVWAQGQDKFPASMRVRKYPMAEKYGWLWIWMGDPALADESKIFDCSNCTNPNFASVKGMMHVQAAAMLTIDNLMDLSHTAFVHEATVGSKDDLNPELTWERKENWIKGTRKGETMTPSAAYIARGASPDYKLDQVKTMAYTPPYNCNVDIYTMETGKKLGEGRFNEKFLTYNLITPETDTTHFYFWANTRDFKLEDKEFDAINLKIAGLLLDEDRRICEAVQRTINVNPRPEVDLVADAGGIQARRILKQLIDNESPTPSSVAAA